MTMIDDDDNDNVYDYGDYDDDDNNHLDNDCYRPKRFSNLFLFCFVLVVTFFELVKKRQEIYRCCPLIKQQQRFYLFFNFSSSI